MNSLQQHRAADIIKIPFIISISNFKNIPRVRTGNGGKKKDKARIKEFIKERDTAIREFDLKKFKRYVKKWHNIRILPSDEVLEIAMRKMCLECTRIPAENKIQACEWLIAHGYLTDMFGSPIIARYDRLKRRMEQER